MDMLLAVTALAGALLGALIVWMAWRGQLARTRDELESLRTQRDRLAVDLATARTALDGERRGHEDKLRFLDQQRATLKAEFQALSQQILEEKSKRFTEVNRQQMEQILNPLREKIGQFEKQVADSYEKESHARVALVEQIRQLQKLNQEITAETRSLTSALKGESRIQGNWGEMILERIFELSGLEKGREYDTQFSVSGDGQRRRPDAVVHLPDGRDVIIDAKVSLTAYVRAVEAADDGDRGRALDEHVASLRAHVRGLSAKDYQDLPGINSLDFVLMFVPSEAAYIEALRHAPDLYSEALGRNIALVSPSTLLPTLRTVENLWKMERQGRNAQRIAEEAGRLYDQFALFEESLSHIGKRLGQATTAYDSARKRLVDGRGNLVGRVEKLRKLGARASKQLPSELVQDAAEADGEAPDALESGDPSPQSPVPGHQSRP